MNARHIALLSLCAFITATAGLQAAAPTAAAPAASVEPGKAAGIGSAAPEQSRWALTSDVKHSYTRQALLGTSLLSLLGWIYNKHAENKTRTGMYRPTRRVNFLEKQLRTMKSELFDPSNPDAFDNHNDVQALREDLMLTRSLVEKNARTHRRSQNIASVLGWISLLSGVTALAPSGYNFLTKH